MFLKLRKIKVRIIFNIYIFILLDIGLFCSVNNYNREKNRRRKINSSGGNAINKNKSNKNNINEIGYFLIKARTPNFTGKNINYIIMNNTKDKNKIKKPRTPEIKNLIKVIKESIEIIPINIKVQKDLLLLLIINFKIKTN